jgi:glycerol-3-phosphate acyltransferase PlsX
MEFTKIAVDVFGGDRAPDVVLQGCELALEELPEIELHLCGKAEVVDPFASTHPRCVAHHASEVIEMGEHPASAVRQKKDSSIVVGCRLVKENTCGGFFSAGSTGACLAAATLVIGRVKGVKRPALGIILPSYNSPTLFLDVGANAEVKSSNLLQFGQMGGAYAKAIMGIDQPKVGLLNIGEEDTKGTPLIQEAHLLMSKNLPSFVGNCEPAQLTKGDFDVVVTDGYTGNIALKTIEGSASMIFKYLKDALLSNTKSKIGAALVKPELAKLKDKLNPDVFGGSPLIGVAGVCVIGHGSSNAEAVKNGIKVTAQTIQADLPKVLAKAVSVSSIHHEG